MARNTPAATPTDGTLLDPTTQVAAPTIVDGARQRLTDSLLETLAYVQKQSQSLYLGGLPVTASAFERAGDYISGMGDACRALLGDDNDLMAILERGNALLEAEAKSMGVALRGDA